MNIQTPTTDEQAGMAIRAYKGIELGIGQADPGAEIYAKLEAQYPDHLVLVQAGKFLHAYDRTAYALSALKNYKLKLVGDPSDPHIRAGFPAGNFKRRLWTMVSELGIPYVVAVGTQATGRTVYVSQQPTGNLKVLAAITGNVVAKVIADLVQHKKLNQKTTRDLLANPDIGPFKLKSTAAELDLLLTQDVTKMPRDFRSTYGENLRVCMARITRNVMAYGLDHDKPALLRQLSTDVDCLKHYLCQAPQLKRLKFAFESRVELAVELGRLVGGLIRAPREAS